MKSFAFVLCACLALFSQASCYVIRTGCSPLVSTANVLPPTVVTTAPSTIVQTSSSSLANSLADTLSLLTVSNLLADTLPYNGNLIGVPVNVPVGVPVGVPVSAYGCGCGYYGLGGVSYFI